MGDSQLPTGISETFDFMEQRIQTTFGSEEEMRRYYLQMANFIRLPHKCCSEESEYKKLKMLGSKLKQFASFTHVLGEHKWEKGVANIQKALAIYLMQNDVDSKERRQNNDEIASQLQFIVYLAENSNLVKQLQGMFDRHRSNVLYLLDSMSVAVEQE